MSPACIVKVFQCLNEFPVFFLRESHAFFCFALGGLALSLPRHIVAIFLQIAKVQTRNIFLQQIAAKVQQFPSIFSLSMQISRAISVKSGSPGRQRRLWSDFLPGKQFWLFFRKFAYCFLPKLFNFQNANLASCPHRCGGSEATSPSLLGRTNPKPNDHILIWGIRILRSSDIDIKSKYHRSRNCKWKMEMKRGFLGTNLHIFQTF